MRIGILTGGGDVPGLNPCIKAVVSNALERDWQVLGIRRGWAGLLELDPDEPGSVATNTLELHKYNTRTIDRTGGTVLHTSRTNPRKMAEAKLPKHIAADRIKKLIPILAVGGLALGLLASRNTQTDEAPAE